MTEAAVLNTTERSLQVFCPAPLLDANENTTNIIPVEGIPVEGITGCAIRCTGTMVDDGDINFFSDLTTIVSGISLALVTFIFLTWGMFWQKARQKMTFWVLFASFMVTTSIFFPAVINQNTEEVWCKDDIEPRRMTDGFSGCVVQGIFIIFFGLSLDCWWFCSCFDIFSKLYRRKKNIQHYLYYYHLFSWTVPIVNTIVILATQNFGFEQPRLWCFLSPEAPGFLEFVFFYAWVGALWMVGTIMMGLVIWSIFAQTRTFRRAGVMMNRKQRARRANYFKKLSLYRTPVIFVLLFSLFWAIFFTFVLSTEAQRAELEADAEAWISCLLFGLSEEVPEPAEELPAELAQIFADATGNDFAVELGACGFTQPNGLSLGLLTVAVLTLSGNGILLFIVFGLQYENFKLWADWLGSLCGNDVNPAGLKKKSKQLSTFSEMRVGTALFFVRCCQRIAGQEVTPRTPYEPRLTERKVDKPILENQAENYTPRYNNQQLPPAQNSPGAYPSPHRALETAPRVSYRNNNNHYADVDPFPGAANGQQPSQGGAGSRYFVDSLAISQAQGSQLQPPAISSGNRGNQEFQEGYEEDNMSSAWSDVYNDPLWGINVEF